MPPEIPGRSGKAASFDRAATVTAERERALAAPAWDGPPVWRDGDLVAGN